METFTEISPQQAWELLQTEENAVLVDIRDNIRFTYITSSFFIKYY